LLSLLPVGLSGCVNVARAGVLLTVEKTSVEYTVIINDLSLLTCCELLCLLVLVLAIADVCHRTQYYEQVVEGSERSKLFDIRLVQKPSSVPTLLPARPSFGYQDNLSVQHVAPINKAEFPKMTIGTPWSARIYSGNIQTCF
jgi:hypothetical protein